MRLSTSFVAIRKITSSTSAADFDGDRIEQLARQIVKSEGIIRPLVLNRTSLESYEVVEGHFEYHAAVRAREIDLRRAEMIAAYIIDPENDDVSEAIAEQIELLRNPPEIIEPGSQSSINLIDLKRTISEQINPLKLSLQDVNAKLDSNNTSSNNAIERTISEQINPLKLSLEGVNAKLDQKVVLPQVSTSQQSIALSEIAISNSVEQQLAELTQTIKNLDQRIPPSVTQVSNMLEELNTLNEENLKKKLEKVGVKGKFLENLVNSVCDGRDGRPYESFSDIISRKDSSGKKKIFTDAGLIKLLEIKVLDLW